MVGKRDVRDNLPTKRELFRMDREPVWPDLTGLRDKFSSKVVKISSHFILSDTRTSKPTGRPRQWLASTQRLRHWLTSSSPRSSFVTLTQAILAWWNDIYKSNFALWNQGLRKWFQPLKTTLISGQNYLDVLQICSHAASTLTSLRCKNKLRLLSAHKRTFNSFYLVIYLCPTGLQN